jgi:uncharacterized coiled-coil DUF342 family protein
MITNIKENLEENLIYEGETTESINDYLSLSDQTIDGERELLSKLKQLYYDRRAEANTQIIKLRAEVDNINKKLEEL